MRKQIRLAAGYWKHLDFRWVAPVVTLSLVFAGTARVADGDEGPASPPIVAAQQRGNKLSRIPAGTVVQDSSSERGFNRVVLVAQPKLAVGDIELVNSSIREAVSSLSLVIMAKVIEEPITESFKLENVGVGYAMAIKGKLTTIDTAALDSTWFLNSGAALGFFARRVLAKNEKQLESIAVRVRLRSLLMFDVPTIFLADGAHRSCLTRHLAWIDSSSGQVALATWLVKHETETIEDQNDWAELALPGLGRPMRIVPAGTREQRRINVAGQHFFLGIPSAEAFALTEMPPGADLEWSQELARFAGLSKYSPQQLAGLVSSINRSMQIKRRADPGP